MIIEMMCNGYTVVDDSIVKALSKDMINRFHSMLAWDQFSLNQAARMEGR